ncbi:uncharacterized protein LOC135216299 [Macrobrachium nipponense]|uniref:uncharacterized protein LOC135216299 n=1 Tax=Macrobrachium nipponense TaxID=159736 RepID=UPI0030C7CB1C
MDILRKCNRAKCQNCLTNWCKPQHCLSCDPLVVMNVLSLFCYVTVIYFSLRDGFKDTVMGGHLAACGTVVVLLVNFAYIFCSVKILFCIKSRTFPTWQEVRELRDTVIYLTFSFIVGTVLIFVVFCWFIEFGRLDKIAVPPRQTTDDSQRITPRGLLGNDKLFVEKSSSTYMNVTAESGKDSLSTSNINGDLSISIQADYNLSDSNSLKNAGDGTEDLKNKSKSYAKDNPPFASLTFSGISFCVAGIVIVLTIMVEKKSALELEARWKKSSASKFLSKGTERSSSCPATSCQMRPFHDESNMGSTSSQRACSQELDDGQKLGEQTSDPVILYPSHRPGMGQYWCSVCNSTLVPSPKSPKYQNSPASKPGKKKSPSQSPEENQEPAHPESKANACRKSLSFDVAVPAEDLPHPVNQKAELGSKPGATDIEVLEVAPSQDTSAWESDGNLESELLLSTDPVLEGDCIEITKM